MNGAVSDVAFYAGLALVGYHVGGTLSAGGLLIGGALFVALTGAFVDER